MKEWIKAAGIRALRTFAQALVASIGCAVVISEVDWLYCLSAAALSAILSILMSIAGLPELKNQAVTQVSVEECQFDTDDEDNT